MTRARAWGAAVVLAVGLSTGVSACTSTVPGSATAAAAPTTATTSSTSSGAPSTSDPPATSSPTAATVEPPVADGDHDVTAMCLFINLGFLQVDGQYLDRQAATVAGTPPPVPTEQVAAAIEQAAADTETFVLEVPAGPEQDAGTAVLAQARALAAAMRAGGGTDPTASTAAFDTLDAACPD